MCVCVKPRSLDPHPHPRPRRLRFTSAEARTAFFSFSLSVLLLSFTVCLPPLHCEVAYLVMVKNAAPLACPPALPVWKTGHAATRNPTALRISACVWCAVPLTFQVETYLCESANSLTTLFCCCFCPACAAALFSSPCMRRLLPWTPPSPAPVPYLSFSPLPSTAQACTLAHTCSYTRSPQPPFLPPPQKKKNIYSPQA